MDLTHAQSQVAGMIHSATPFDAIEDQIQLMPDLVDDERSALWLTQLLRSVARTGRNIVCSPAE
jgi:hypothetical protein